MGQQEVYDFLMKNPDSWYTSKEISEQLSVSIGSVTMSLKKLRKTNIIKYRNTGKRNTFQYMVQSEPAKLLERKAPFEQQAINAPVPELQKVRVKIKPKIVHQHTYLSGQTFYGVIRPKEEVEAIERQRVEQQAAMVAKLAAKEKRVVKVTRRVSVKRTAARKVEKTKPRKVLRSRSTARTTRLAKAKPKKKAKR